MNYYPCVECFSLAKFEAKRPKIQFPLLRLPVVAVETVVFQEGLQFPRLLLLSKAGNGYEQ